ncbi:MAG: hypothetical protein DRQ89_15090 [Epsilonproteobacteria bacterium]|nr:MAG: hypothetical protein DRQ89_15090 [Campylobacterota bacterium]
MIEHFIFALLDADVPLTALIDSRIYPVQVPQNGTFPCAIYSVDEDEAEKSYDGQGTFQRVNFEIDAWADEHADAISTGAAVQTAMKNYRGTLAGVQVDTIYIESVITVYEDAIEKYRQTVLGTIFVR